jgi:hypothetical protein
VVRLLLSVCPDFHWVRYIDSWRSNSRTQIGKYCRRKNGHLFYQHSTY